MPWPARRRRRRSERDLPATAVRPELLRLLAGAMNELSGTWAVDGERVRGPGTLALLLAEHPDLAVPRDACHIDVGFVLHVDNPDAPVLWDCASGFGAGELAARESAVRAWSLTTAPVVLELIHHQGEFAEHYPGSSPQGVAGRHTIHGAILGWGFGEGPDALQSWWLAHPLLPVIGPSLEPELGPLLSTVRVFFGSQAGQATAEVRVDGRSVPAAEHVLLGLDWPRSDDVAYVRAFALTMPDRD